MDVSFQPSSPLRPPRPPAHDPDVPAEGAIIARLAGNWGRRATVKRAEPDLLELFEPERPDLPEALVPFHDHPEYRRLPESVRDRLRAWGWIAFNKNVIDIEQHVVNQGFQALAEDRFGTGLGDTLTIAATQAMVDEQYHTLMHLNANVVTRACRGWALPERELPLCLKVRSQRRDLDLAESDYDRGLVSLGYTTVAEISINAFLDLVASDDSIQPINKSTAVLHSRDEHCHSSIAAELAGIVYDGLGARDRGVLLTSMTQAMNAFAATDFTTWAAILHREAVPCADRILDETRARRERARILQDFSGLHRLFTQWDVLDDVPFDWSLTTSR